MPPRQLTPLELNHLRKHGLYDLDPTSIGDQPVEYLTGHADFFGLDFLVTSDTLIPRLESEYLVQQAIQIITDQKIAHPIIGDLGTGTGCLGLSLALNLTRQQTPYTIFLSDISPDALEVAKQNAERLLPSTVNLFFELSDLFSHFPPIKFDLLLANLPYIPTSNIAHLDASVRDHEPQLALDGGPDGALYLNRFLKDLPNFLSDRGTALLEINDTHTLSNFVIPSSLSAQIQKDLHGLPRYLIVCHPSQTLLD